MMPMRVMMNATVIVTMMVLDSMAEYLFQELRCFLLSASIEQ